MTSIEISVDNPGDYAFNRLYTKLQELATEGLNLGNVTGIVLSLMQFVQTIGGLTGPQKKNLVVSVIKKFITEEVADSDLAANLKVFADLTLPTIIDSFVSLNNGETRIKVKNCLATVFKKCLSCCKLTN